MALNPHIALFPGSFDPFTIGHADLVVRALPLFDKIIIGFGINAKKTPVFDLEWRKNRVKQYFQNEPKIEVATFSSLTIDFALKNNAKYIIKGIRNTQDCDYELAQANANRELSCLEIETIFIPSLPHLGHISSSLVRDLYQHNKDIQKLIV